MNISPINNNQVNTNFGALKELQFIGKFKKSPRAQERLLDAFEKSEPLKRFCETFDTKVFFDAYKVESGVIRSRMVILYDEIAEKNSSIKEWIKSKLAKSKEIIIDAGSPFTFSPENAAGDLVVRMVQTEGHFDYRMQEYETAKQSQKDAKAALLEQKEAELKEIDEKTRIQNNVNDRIKNLLGK